VTKSPCEAFLFHPRTTPEHGCNLAYHWRGHDASRRCPVLLTPESIWKVDAGMVKSGMVVCYNAAWKHEPITL
jgi:hypothetical protein